MLGGGGGGGGDDGDGDDDDGGAGDDDGVGDGGGGGILSYITASFKCCFSVLKTRYGTQVDVKIENVSQFRLKQHTISMWYCVKKNGWSWENRASILAAKCKA